MYFFTLVIIFSFLFISSDIKISKSSIFPQIQDLNRVILSFLEKFFLKRWYLSIIFSVSKLCIFNISAVSIGLNSLFNKILALVILSA
ncbi:hypothetical protein HOG21_04500 [bacterium]|nr:hypothetical protein [bacterium]